VLTVQPIARSRASRVRASEVLDGLMGLLAIILMAASWATHIVVCAMDGLWSLLAFGVLVFPVAILHGVAVWVAAWV
jgi:hypothetical protein